MNDGFFTFALWVAITATATLAWVGNCGGFSSKQEQCTDHCRDNAVKPKHDGALMTFDKHGYECRCANLQAVSE